MLGRTPESFGCQCAPRRLSALADRGYAPYSEAARRANVLLDVADILTEKPTLSEMDINALEVVLAAARTYVREILWWSEQLPNAERDAEPPWQ